MLMEVHHAVLYRLLADLFGKDNVIPNMSVSAVCGGAVPDLGRSLTQEIENRCQLSVGDWGKASKCLFTVLNESDDPRMVVELAAGCSEVIDAAEVTNKQFIEPVVVAAGINYVVISADELRDIMDPSGDLTMFKLLQDRFGLSE